MARNDGGAAFPRAAAEYGHGGHYEQDGMSLRDWFAGQALSGISGHLSEMISADIVSKEEILEGFTAASIMAFKLADAMLAEREKDNA